MSQSLRSRRELTERDECDFHKIPHKSKTERMPGERLETYLQVNKDDVII